MSAATFDPNDPTLSPATLELLLRLDGLTSRLERCVVVLEQTIGPDGEEECS